MVSMAQRKASEARITEAVDAVRTGISGLESLTAMAKAGGRSILTKSDLDNIVPMVAALNVASANTLVPVARLVKTRAIQGMSQDTKEKVRKAGAK